jgi:hypothetical protein
LLLIKKMLLVEMIREQGFLEMVSFVAWLGGGVSREADNNDDK